MSQFSDKIPNMYIHVLIISFTQLGPFYPKVCMSNVLRKLYIVVLIQVQIISRQYSPHYKLRFVFAISSKTIVSILKFFRKSSSSMGSSTSLGSFFVSSSQSIMVHEFHNNNWLQKNYGYNKFPDVLASYSNHFLHRSTVYILYSIRPFQLFIFGTFNYFLAGKVNLISDTFGNPLFKKVQQNQPSFLIISIPGCFT